VVALATAEALAGQAVAANNNDNINNRTTTQTTTFIHCHFSLISSLSL
jgi:hypothetical protein